MKAFFRRLPWIAITAATTLAQDDCAEVCLDIVQGYRYFGRFPPIRTRTNVVDFYRYKHYNFNGDDIVPLLMDHSVVLIHHDELDCDLSLVIVHDSKEDSTGGQVHMLVSGNHESPLVQDGPGDGSKSDRYLYIEDMDQTELFWEWGWQSNKFRTDGLADGWEEECLKLKAKFIVGIDAWRFVPGPLISGKANPNEYLFLDQDETLIVCKVDCDTPPQSVWQKRDAN